jgi:DNA-binding NarL/FixJ family response regulator
LLGDVVVGRGGSVVVAGAAGVGKSRLVAEFLDGLGEHDLRVARVRATRSTATIPFGPFAAWAPERSDDRLQVLRGIGTALTVGEAPVVVAVDDAHLLDPGSAALLQHLVEHTTARVVCTLRTGEDCPDAVTALWHEGPAEHFELAPLPASATVELLTQVLDGPLTEATGERLWDLSLGSPLYLSEVVRAALEQKVLTRGSDGWRWDGTLRGSAELTALIGDHLAGADPEERRLAERLAYGEPLPLLLIEQMGAAETVAAAEKRGSVVVEDASSGTTVRLAHPLYGDLLRERTAPQKARRRHRELAAAARACDWQERDPLRVAQWSLAADADKGDPVVLLAAANRAFLLAEWDLSARLAKAAETAGAGDAAALARAAALVPLGRFADADQLWASVAARSKEPSVVATATVWRADLHFSWLGDEAKALELLEDGLERLPSPYKAQVLGFGGMLAVLALDPARAVRFATEAAAEAGPAVAVRVQALATAALGLMAQGRTADAVGLAEIALPYAPIDAEAGTRLDADLPWTYALALAFRGRFEEAAALADGLWHLARREGLTFFQGRAATLVGALALPQGRLGLALRAGRVARTVMGANELSPHWPAAIMASAAAQLGDSAAAEAALERVQSERPPPRLLRLELGLARAWLAGARGELTVAQELARSAAADAADAGAWGWEMQALLVAARLGAAEAVSERLQELAGIVDGPYASAIAAYASAAAAGDGPTLDVASVRMEEMGALIVAAEASAAAASAYAAEGHSDSQLAALARARALTAQCDGARTPALRDLDADPRLGTLTAREREVVDLAAQGLTNRRIGKRLQVPTRAVNTHLAQAYSKLGLDDRAQLARVLTPA